MDIDEGRAIYKGLHIRRELESSKQIVKTKLKKIISIGIIIQAN